MEFRNFCPACTEEMRKDVECVLLAGDGKRTRICQTCFDLYQALSNNPYFLKLHEDYLTTVRDINRLRPGRDYFK